MVEKFIIRLRLLLAISLISFCMNTQALTAFVGASTNYAGLGALRVGVSQWEFGLYANGSLGVNKIFKTSNSYYATFGFGLNSVLSPSILAGVGFNYLDFVGFGLRGELFTITSVSGNLYGAGTLGVSWNF